MRSPRPAIFFALAVACSGTTATLPALPDAATDAFESAPDITRENVPDVSPARDVGPDLSSTPREGDPCASVVDLQSRGVVQNGDVTFVADGTLAPERTVGPLPGCGTFRPELSFVTAFRYTARTTTVVYFQVIDRNPAQPLRLYVLLADRCASDARSSACLIGGGDDRPLDTQTQAPVPAGSSVYLLVGTHLPVPAFVDVAGRFEVRARELPRRAIGEPCAFGEASCADGAACDPFLRGRCVPAGGLQRPCLPEGRCEEGLMCDAGYCHRALVAGERCGPEQPLGRCPADAPCNSNGTAYHCLPLGTRGSNCRAAASRCDPGLSCVFDRCVAGLAEGERCALGRPCAEGLRCAAPTGVLEGVCTRDGARGGYCRASAPRCDRGLACASDGSNRCLPAVALDTACDEYNQVSTCAEGTCSNNTCRADGANGGLCRASSVPCDPGLRCSGGPLRCSSPATAGASCDGRACPAATTCAAEGDLYGRCLRDGANGGRCRRSDPACDAGLACARSTAELASPRCRPAVSVGAACDPTRRLSACVEGSVCASDGVCRRSGEVGGFCRDAAPFCDDGLRCVERTATYPGRCERILARGEGCMFYRDLCPSGQTCVNPVRPVCVDDGTARDARCRATAPACDPGLVCAPVTGRCVEEVALGEGCDAPEAYFRCVAGASCVPLSEGVARCVRDGVAGGRCRTSGSACDAGLRCTGAPLAQNARCL
jgi:hypothetical protein